MRRRLLQSPTRLSARRIRRSARRTPMLLESLLRTMFQMRSLPRRRRRGSTGRRRRRRKAGTRNRPTSNPPQPPHPHPRAPLRPPPKSRRSFRRMRSPSTYPTALNRSRQFCRSNNSTSLQSCARPSMDSRSRLRFKRAPGLPLCKDVMLWASQRPEGTHPCSLHAAQDL